MPLKAVLLDFDGVIADTDNHHVAAWQRTLSAYGMAGPRRGGGAVGGDRRPRIPAGCSPSGDRLRKIDDWVRRKQVLTVQLLREFAATLSGVGGVDPESPAGAQIGGRLRHLAREHPGCARGLRPGRFLRHDRRQGRRDAVKPAPEATACAQAASALGEVGGRHRRFAVRPRLGARGYPRHRRRPSPPLRRLGGRALMSRDSSRSRGCSSI